MRFHCANGLAVLRNFAVAHHRGDTDRHALALRATGTKQKFDHRAKATLNVFTAASLVSEHHGYVTVTTSTRHEAVKEDIIMVRSTQ